MGFKAIDLSPIAAYGPTAVTPPNKDVIVKAFVVNRTDTVSTVKCVLPADSTIIALRVYSTAASNAGTSAVINVGTPTSATYFLNGADVKTAAGQLAVGSVTSNLFNLDNYPLGADIQITGQYVEAGTASSAGGPYYVTVEYVR